MSRTNSILGLSEPQKAEFLDIFILKKKVKVPHSLIAVGVVGVRVPLYLGHS